MTFKPPEPKANSEERKVLQIRASTHAKIQAYAKRHRCSMTKIVDAIIKAHMENYPL